MTTSRAFIRTNRNANEYGDDGSIYNERYTPIVLRPESLEYRPREQEREREREREIVYVDKNELSRGTRPKSTVNCCSKLCFIGFFIGLLIGLCICVAVAVPVGVIKNCLGQFASTPNWIGTYQMDGNCDTSLCCCLTNQITITQTSNNSLQISGNINGMCNGLPSPIIFATSTPSTFTAQFYWGSDKVIVQMGQNNLYVAFYPLTRVGSCSTTGLKTSNNIASEKHISLYLIGLALFTILIRMR